MSFLDKARPVATTTPSGAPSFVQKARPVAPKREFRFDVPEPEQERQNRIGRYQQEAQASAEESKKANSFMGILGNTVKNVGATLANSEVGLGKSIAKIFGAGDTALTDAQKSSTDTEVALLKRINEKKAKGEDTTRLKQAYNTLKGGQGEVNELVKEQFNLPTTGQVAGQIGGTALDVLTAGTYSKAARSAPSFSRFVQPSKVTAGAVASGLPELAPIARQTPGGLFTMKGAGNVAMGTGIGYASDVTQGLQGARGEDRTGAKAFIPGAGTALGFTLPAVAETAQSVKNVRTGQGTITKRRTALDDIEKRYSNVQKVFSAGDRKGVDVRGILSETNILNGAVDDDGLVSAGRALENFDELVAPYENKVREAIQKEGAKVRIADVANAMDDFVSKSNLESGAYQKLNTELLQDLKGLQAKYGDNIPVEALHDTKIFRGNASNYVDTGANVVNKEATRFFKEAVENNVRSLDVKDYNGELSKLYTVRDAIEALDKKRVKGGRMGKYFSSVIGTGIGASSGNPLLAILGAEIGTRTQGKILGRAFGGQLDTPMQIPDELINMANKKVPAQDLIPPVVIPKKKDSKELNLQSKSLGNLNMSQRTTNAPTTNVIPKTVLPVKEVSSKLPTPRQVNDAKIKEQFGELPKVKTQGKEMFAGGAVGLEQDENGEWVFNEEKALAGMVGVAGLTRSQKVQKLSQSLSDNGAKILDNFVTAVKAGGITKDKNGMLVFKEAGNLSRDEVEEAFMRGLDVVIKEKPLTDFGSATPNRIANLYQDILDARNKTGKYKVEKPLGSVTPKTTNNLADEIAKAKAGGKTFEEYLQSLPAGGKEGREMGIGEGLPIIKKFGWQPFGSANETIKLYRGYSNKSNNKLVDGDFLTTSRRKASAYGTNVIEVELPKNQVVRVGGNEPTAFGLPDSEVFIYNTGKTKAKLTDIWNKAQGK